MIIISTVNNNYIPYQNKINKIINTLLDNISLQFKDTNPILSGSYLLSLIVSQDTYYSDYDFYFESNSEFTKASNLLDKTLEVSYRNDNCVTYESPFDTKSIQLINSIQGIPQAIISNHDLQNSKIAYQNNKLFFTKDFVKAWAQNEIDLFSFQIENYHPKNYQKIFNSTLSTLLRIKKYKSRYSLDLSFSSRKKIENLILYLEKNKKNLNPIFKNLTISNSDSYSATFPFEKKDVTVTFDFMLNLAKSMLTQEFQSGLITPF